LEFVPLARRLYLPETQAVGPLQAPEAAGIADYEDGALFYSVGLVAYGLILLAIWQKNRPRALMTMSLQRARGLRK